MKRYAILFCCSLTACAGHAAQRGQSADTTDPVPDERPLASTLVYECDGYQFVARPAPGAMTLWLEDRSVALPQARSASGTLYEEGDISFWSKGEEAMLTVAGKIYQNCHLLPTRIPWEDARRSGISPVPIP
jgi:membrane-bound inhibitor of C-type lysozyme